MHTGFKELDKLIDLNEPQLIALTGSTLVDMLSGDIANNICLHQEKEVLEIVSHKKEYLIKRLFVNQANVDYRNWTLKDKYTDAELKQIGQATVNLIEVTKRLPTILETEIMNLKDIKQYIEAYANNYADRDTIETLIVLDIFPLNNKYHIEKYEGECVGFIKDISIIRKRLKCPIIFVYYGNFRRIKSYVDKIIITTDKELQNRNIELRSI